LLLANARMRPACPAVQASGAAVLGLHSGTT
jgi:hypothetical protein